MKFRSIAWQRCALLAFCAGLPAWTLYWGTTALLGTYDGDNAVYWLTANHLAGGPGAHPAAAHFAAGSVFPPLYPLLLAWTGGGADLQSAHAVSALVAGFGLLASAWFARRCGLPLPLAGLLVVACGASRGVLLEQLELHSEHLYLAASVAALALAGRGSGAKRLALATVAVAAATLTRSFGLTLLAAFLLWLCCTRPRHWPSFALLAAAPAVAFALAADSDERYLTALFDAYAAGGIGERLWSNLEHLWRGWLALFGERAQPGFHPLAPAVLAGLAALGCARRLAAGELDAIYTIAAAALMLVWPFPAEYSRFLYPLLPVLAVQAVCVFGGRDASSATWRRPTAALPVVLLLAAELPFLGLFAARYAEPPPGDLAPYQRSAAWYYHDARQALATVAYQQALRHAFDEIAFGRSRQGQGCVLAAKRAIVSLYTRQVAQALPSATLAPDALLDAVRRSPCRRLLMVAAATPTYPEAYFPWRRLRRHLRVVAVQRHPLLTRPVAVVAELAPATPAARDQSQRRK